MNNFDLEKLLFELKEIEAVLGLFCNLNDNVNIQYVTMVSMEYHDKVQSILRQLQNEIEKNISSVLY